MIDEYYTFLIFGYRVDELSKWKKVPVVAMCDKCCEYRTVRYDSYRDLCGSCSHKEMVRNEEWNHNISAGLMGHVVTEDTRRNMVNGAKGRKMPPASDEARANMSKAQKGKTKSDEHKRKISEANRGHKPSDEARQKLSATLQGIPYEDWTEFVSNGEYCEKFDEACRERIRAKYDRRCFMCDKPQDKNITKNGKQEKLSVHHTDMNIRAGCDGHEWRLVPLCKICHGGAHSQPLKSRVEYLRADEEHSSM